MGCLLSDVGTKFLGNQKRDFRRVAGNGAKRNRGIVGFAEGNCFKGVYLGHLWWLFRVFAVWIPVPGTGEPLELKIF
jgi:hypothetical protein